MCGCTANIIPASQASSYVNTIPLQELTLKPTRAQYKYYYCVSPIKVNQALGIINVKPNEPLRVGNMLDMEQLADMHDRGDDIKYHNQNFTQLLSGIVFTQEELNKSECSTAFTV